MTTNFNASGNLSLLEDNDLNSQMQSEFIPDKLVGDQVRLQQVLINLTKNALKFTRKGRITLIIAYDYVHEQLQVHVKDTGKGIAQEELN